MTLMAGCLHSRRDVPSFGRDMFDPGERSIDPSDYEFTHQTWSIPQATVIPTDLGPDSSGIREGVLATTEVNVPEPVGARVTRYSDRDAFGPPEDLEFGDLEEDIELVDEMGEYDVYHVRRGGGNLYQAVDEDEMVALEVQEFDRETLELKMDTVSGEAPSYPEVDEDVAELLGDLGEGDFVRGRTTSPPGLETPSSAFGVRLRLEEDTMKLRYTQVKDAAPEPDPLVSFVEEDLGDDGEVLESSVNGDVVRVDAESDLAENPGERERIPMDS